MVTAATRQAFNQPHPDSADQRRSRWPTLPCLRADPESS